MLSIALLAGFPTAGFSQEGGKRPKIDSLLLQLPQPKVEAMDLVLESFARAGLSVTDNSESLVESDVGATVSGFTGVKYTRIVRAFLIGRDPTTSVLIAATEERNDQRGFRKQVRISNRTGGNGEKVWRKMVAVAMALDSIQVPAAAIKPEKS
jgi:hypothetical protein